MGKWDRTVNAAILAVLLVLLFTIYVPRGNDSVPKYQENVVSHCAVYTWTLGGFPHEDKRYISQGENETQDAYDARRSLWHNNYVAYLVDQGAGNIQFSGN